jgi:hypothetical protein
MHLQHNVIVNQENNFIAELQSKNNDWLTLNQDNVFGWGIISTLGLLFQ